MASSRFSQAFASVYDVGDYLAQNVPASTYPKTSSASLRIGASDFGVFDYVVKRGNQNTFIENQFFGPQKDTRAAFIVIDGNLTVPSGVTFIPATRKLFTVVYVSGNLSLQGTISMTARGANHSGTGDSAGYVQPQDIPITTLADLTEENPNLGNGNAMGYEIMQSSYYVTAPAKLAFNKTNINNGDCWVSAWVGFVAPQWLQIKYPAAVTLVRHSVTARTADPDPAYPLAFSVLGSNDGTTWTEIPGSSQSGLSWTAAETKSFTLNSTVAYTYYRLNITQSWSTQFVIVAQWKLFTSPTATAQIPAAGGAGGLEFGYVPGFIRSDGRAGSDAIGGGTGGGGTGAVGGNSSSVSNPIKNGGAQGTAYSGGGGSGGFNAFGGDNAAKPNGGAGGNGFANSVAGGGAGNPGGSSIAGGSLGGTGTGGTLVLIVRGSISGSGTIVSSGSAGGDASGTEARGGGGSGGGSVVVLFGSGSPIAQALGGAAGVGSNGGGNNRNGGAGGNGSARLLLLPSSGLLVITRKVPSSRTIPRLLTDTYTSVYDVCEYLCGIGAASTIPKTSAGSLKIQGNDFGVFEYVLKRGPLTLSTFNENQFFGTQKDTRAAFVLVDGNVNIPAGVTMIPNTRKLFTVLYITGNLVLNGSISMTARGANHSGTGDSGGFVQPQAIRITNASDLGEENPSMTGATNTGTNTYALNGYDVRSQSSGYGQYVYYLFDKTSSPFFSDTGSGLPQWVQFGYPDARVLKAYSVTCEILSGGVISSMRLDASSTIDFSSNVVTIDPLRSVTWAAEYSTNLYRLQNNASAYRYYRLYFVTGSNNFVRVSEWKLYTALAGTVEIPATGGAGGAGSTQIGNAAPAGTSGQSGGGGGGGGYVGVSQGGAAGTAFSGGAGAGGISGTTGTSASAGTANGGAGGVGEAAVYAGNVGGGAGNPGGLGAKFGASTAPPQASSGTGGTIIVIVKGTLSGSGSVASIGSTGGGTSGSTTGGGGSGGGSITILAGGNTGLTTMSAAGGAGGTCSNTRIGGAGGNGSTRLLLLPSPVAVIPRNVPSSRGVSLAFAATLRRLGLESSVACAFGLRRLLWGYRGPLVQVRNSLGVLKDIYEDPLTGIVNSSALTTHAAGGSLWVQTWYDQSGKGRHATQNTLGNQPRCSLASTWGTPRPTLAFDSSSKTYLNYNGSPLVNTPYSVFATVARGAGVGFAKYTGGSGASGNTNLILGFENATTLRHSQFGSANDVNYTVPSAVTQAGELHVYRHSPALGKNAYRNGVLLGSAPTNTTSLVSYADAVIGMHNLAVSTFQGDIPELIMFSSYVADINRASLESLTKSYFSIA